MSPDTVIYILELSSFCQSQIPIRRSSSYPLSRIYQGRARARVPGSLSVVLSWVRPALFSPGAVELSSSETSESVGLTRGVQGWGEGTAEIPYRAEVVV